jgi:DNA polymerase-3 subunit epsilon
MYLIYDTETSGLPAWNQRSNDPCQPHIVQAAMLLVGDDGRERSSAALIVRPEGWIISPEMTAIHGISHERAMDEGVPEGQVTDLYVALQATAALRVAHNEHFDRRIMRIAMLRAGISRPEVERIEARPSFCTCNASTRIVKLPPSPAMLAKNMRWSKTPKLAECYAFFFDEEMADAHTALGDARACNRVYGALKALQERDDERRPAELG